MSPHKEWGEADMGIIKIQNLTRDYGGGKGVFDISFAVEEGEVFGFLGPNGAGKTTTIRHLMGFVRPEKGTCTIKGMDCRRQREIIQATAGYLAGEISMFDEMTGAEYLKFIEEYREKGICERKKDLMDRFELDGSVRIRKMSKGMKQKLGIIAAFMPNPDILILDEPTSGLDPLMQQRFVSLICEEKKQGKTILMSSHIFEEVEKTCDRVGLIRSGRMVTISSIENLKRQHSRTYRVTLEDEEQAGSFAHDFSGQAAGKQVILEKMQSLEEIFLEYYGEEKK